MPNLLIFFLCFWTLPCLLECTIPYSVVFQGTITESTKEVILSNSQLKLLEQDPPLTLIALKRRAEADIPNLIYALHSLAYYNARVSFEIEEQADPVRVRWMIETGPVYPLLGYNLTLSFPEDYDQNPLDSITLSDIQIALGTPAFAKTILEGETNLLELLAQRGYPLASIEQRKVVADQKIKGIFVTLSVNPGLRVVFGETFVHGLETVKPSIVLQRIAWTQGFPYDPQWIAKTEFELESLGLFNSITIVEKEQGLEKNQLPIDIYLREGCHRTIGFGVSYNTQLGPGGTFYWAHRNMRGRGERLRLKTDIWQKKQTGLFEYTIPDFFTRYQELKWLVEADKEQTEGFDEFYYSASIIVDKKINPCLKISYGTSYKQLFSSKSDNNKPSTLLKTPLHLKWTQVDEPYNPTFGCTLNLRCVPTLSVRPRFGYAIHLATLTGYLPLRQDRVVLALKAHVGSIYGSSRYTIPPPERLYAGSECLLRGYKYMTVSPLDKENKPIGGRSIMIYSLETRLKLKQSFGWAFFFEAGNVYSQIFPQFNHKQLQSAGLGFRYYTQVGPLRFDLAFPINPREGIDKPFQLYISIGQAF